MQNWINRETQTRRGLATLEYVLLTLCIGCAITVAALTFGNTLSNALKGATAHLEGTSTTAASTGTSTAALSKSSSTSSLLSDDSVVASTHIASSNTTEDIGKFFEAAHLLYDAGTQYWYQIKKGLEEVPDNVEKYGHLLSMPKDILDIYNKAADPSGWLDLVSDLAPFVKVAKKYGIGEIASIIKDGCDSLNAKSDLEWLIAQTNLIKDSLAFVKAIAPLIKGAVQLVPGLNQAITVLDATSLVLDVVDILEKNPGAALKIMDNIKKGEFAAAWNVLPAADRAKIGADIVAVSVDVALVLI
ncbi:TPA: hypothetical protein DDW35_07620 [Candidatus Sumerlaeota bacterium]|jgi:hypothetical protein|nr:hypothetical protein [Candidatus Sumerlaeota bacterium]